MKIKDVENWNRSSSRDSIENPTVNNSSFGEDLLRKIVDADLLADSGDLTINQEVKVTFYKMKMFTEMFSDYFTNFDVLHKSLSPKYNRDMVF